MKILLVENNGVLKMEIEYFLMKEGHLIYPTSTVNPCVFQLDLIMYDLIIIEEDQFNNLPVGLFANTPLILLTTDARNTENGIQQSNIIKRINKPLSGNQILQVINQKIIKRSVIK